MLKFWSYKSVSDIPELEQSAYKDFQDCFYLYSNVIEKCLFIQEPAIKKFFTLEQSVFYVTVKPIVCQKNINLDDMLALNQYFETFSEANGYFKTTFGLEDGLFYEAKCPLDPQYILYKFNPTSKLFFNFIKHNRLSDLFLKFKTERQIRKSKEFKQRNFTKSQKAIISKAMFDASKDDNFVAFFLNEQF